MSNEEIKLDKNQTRLLRDGEYTITHMEPKSKIKATNCEIEVAGLMYEGSEIRGKKNTDVKILPRSDVFGRIITTGDVYINGIVPEEAQISCDTLIIGGGSRILGGEIYPEEIKVIPGANIRAGTNLSDIKGEIEIQNHVTIEGGPEEKITYLGTTGKMMIASPITWVINPGHVISLKGFEIEAAEVDFPAMELLFTKNLQARSLNGTKVRLVGVAQAPNNVFATSADGADIKARADIIITNLKDTAIEDAHSVTSVSIRGGKILAGGIVHSDLITDGAFIRARDVNADDIGNKAVIEALDVTAVTVGGESEITARNLHVKRIGLCRIKADGEVEADVIGPATIKADVVKAGRIHPGARIEAEEIYIGGKLVAEGKWPQDNKRQV